MCCGGGSAMSIPISSSAASIKTKQCRWPKPPCCCDTDCLPASDTRGCCCCRRTSSFDAEGTSAGEDSGGVPVADGGSFYYRMDDTAGRDTGETLAMHRSLMTTAPAAAVRTTLRAGVRVISFALHQSMVAAAGTKRRSPEALAAAGLGHRRPPS